MDTLFKTFLAKYNGVFVEKTDSSNLNQCFDLAVAWAEWLGLPLSIFNGLLYAYQIYTNPTQLARDNFTLIPNTPDGVPQAGDIVVWSKSYNGTAGHVGIATGVGDVNHFQCFVQNDPIGSSSHLKDYNYTAVLGWLRYKQPIVSPDCSAITAERDKLNGVISGKDELIGNLNQQIAQKNATMSTLELEKKSLADQLGTCQSTSQLHLEQANKAVEYKQQVDHLEEQKSAWITKEQEYIKQVKTLQTRNENLKKPIQKLILAIADKLGVQI